MTKKDESPEEATNPYWSDELLAVLAEALGDEDRARQTLEGIIQQAQEGKAMQTLSTERLASYLTELYGRIAEGVQNSGVKKRRSLDTKSGVVAQAAARGLATRREPYSRRSAIRLRPRPRLPTPSPLHFVVRSWRPP